MRFLRLVSPIIALALVGLTPGWSSGQTQKTRNKALVAAVVKHNVTQVQALLASGADPNANDADGVPVLRKAAQVGSVPICEALLKKGARVDGTGKFWTTPLLSAVALKHPNVVKLLLAHKAKAQVSDPLLGSPINAAAKTGQVEVAKLLLDNGAKAGNEPANVSYPLASAVKHEYVQVVDLLLSRGAPVNEVADEDGETPLMLAAETGNVEIVKLLLHRGAQAGAKDKAGHTVLDHAKGEKRDAILDALKQAGAKEAEPTALDAVRQDDVRLLRALLDKGADPNLKDSQGKTALFYAMDSFDATDLVQALLDKGANPNARDAAGETPIGLAKASKVAMVQILLDAGAYAPEFEFVDAVTAGNTATVTQMLDAGVSANSSGLGGQTALILASSVPHLDIAKLLLERGADLKARDGQGKTALNYAVMMGHMDVVRFLLDKGADAKVTTENGDSILMDLSDKPSLDLLRLLVEHGAGVRGRTKDMNRTVLMDIAPKANEQVLQYVLGKGALADINARDNYGATALIQAASAGNAPAVRVLLAKGANPQIAETSGGMTALHMALYTNRKDHPDANIPEVVRLLLAGGAKVNAPDSRGVTPIQYALKEGDEEAAAVLVKAGARMPKQNRRADLVPAAFDEDIGEILRLLAKNTNPNTAGELNNTPLMAAARRGSVEIAGLLLAHGAKADFRVKEEGSHPPTALMLAAEEGKIELVRLLLKHGANPNAQWGGGTSALMDAAQKGRAEVCRLLLDAGANLQFGAENGWTPLHEACRMMSNGKTVDVLVSRGAKVNLRGPAGYTPLLLAAENGMAEAVPALLKAGADPKAKMDDGRTLLMMAARSGKAQIVKLLLQKGQEINARDSRKWTALSYALDAHSDDVIQILKDAGATE